MRTLRRRVTIAAVAAMVVTYLIVAWIIIDQVAELNASADSIQSALGVFELISAFNDDSDPLPDLERILPDGSSAAVMDPDGISLRFGPHPELLVQLGDVEDGDIIDIAGQAHVVVSAPCRPGIDDGCVVRTAVPTEGFWGALVENVWILLSIGAIVIAATVVLTWWLVGRALGFLRRLSDEINDISDSRERYELTRPQGDDEVNDLVDTLNRMLERLHESRRNEQRFLANASHELRSPVTAIAITTENVAADPTRRNSDDTWERLASESHRLQRVVNQLLALAQTEHTAQLLEPVDIGAALRGHADPTNTDDVEFVIDTCGQPFALATEALADRILSNLCENAARHARSRVDAVLTRADDMLELRIGDDGPGIPADRRNDVFEAFTRLDDARSATDGGAGLGLAIARSAARACGGDITIEFDAAHGDGTVFVCRLRAISTAGHRVPGTR